MNCDTEPILTDVDCQINTTTTPTTTINSETAGILI